jgi:Lrp/AsnC family transcriptional regulator
MKDVTSRFAMERMKYTTAYPLHNGAFRDRRALDETEEN